jgi:LysR family cys regulon transcriptional activator
MLLDGQVDIGIATEALNDIPNLVHFPFYSWTHSVIIPIGHPLEQIPYPSLEDIAAYPIITYYSGMTGRAKIDAAFAAAGVSPDIVLSALDSDVVKTYVELGLGIGIVASVAFNSQRDSNLRMLDCTRIFEANTTHIAVRHGNYLRGYAFQFMELCSANLTEASVRKALAAGADEV